MMKKPGCGAVCRNMEEGPLTCPKGSGKASWKVPYYEFCIEVAINLAVDEWGPESKWSLDHV